MDCIAMETVAAAGQESGGGARWMPSTNWIVAGGSLQDAISFETAEDDALAPAISTPVVLVSPPQEEDERDDNLPCEVTICLNGKHEIHRIYVCSTAQVYEIYCAMDNQNNTKEYLCTVHCGVAAKEVRPLSCIDVAFVGCECEGYATSENLDMVSLDDCNSSNEDGWVEVNVSGAPLHHHRTNASRQVDGNSDADFQMYYEATADISDASPCMSVTLRFLSLQMETCVHVSEIYIYADPVESPSPGAPVSMEEKIGGSSLLAMFMPSFLQLSKMGVIRQDKFFDASGVHKCQHNVQKAAGVASSGMEFNVSQEANSDKAVCMLGHDHQQIQLKPEFLLSPSSHMVTDQESYSSMADRRLDQAHEQSEVKQDNMPLGSSQQVTEKEASSTTTLQETKARLENVQLTYSKKEIDIIEVAKSSAQEEFTASDNIERVLDELVSKVTRIEAFCSRFEENLLKPLSSMETRLQKLEQLFHTFAAGDQFHKKSAWSRISVPEFSSDESDSENKDSCNLSSAPGDDTVLNNDPSLPIDIAEDPSFLAAGVTASVPESRMYRGLVVKAPELSNKDDGCVKYDASLASDLNCNEGWKHFRDEASLVSDLNCSEDKSLSSIDWALASALETFLSSKASPSMVEFCKFSTSDENGFNIPPARVLSNGADNSVGTLNEVKEEIAAASEMSVRKSEGNTGCSISGTLERSAALDDPSLSANTLVSSLPSFLMRSGLIFKAPEFPIDQYEFINCVDTSDYTSDDCHEDQGCMCMDGGRVSNLATFLSLRKLKTSSCSSNVVATSSYSYNPEKSETSSFMVGVPCEGADGLYTQNHGNSIKGMVDFDLNVLPAETRLDCDYGNIKYCNCFMEVLIEGSSSIHPQCFLQKGQVKLHQCCSTLATASEEGLFMDDLCPDVSFRSNCGANKEWQGVLLDDSDDDQAEGWTGSSGTYLVDWTGLSSKCLSSGDFAAD